MLDSMLPRMVRSVVSMIGKMIGKSVRLSKGFVGGGFCALHLGRGTGCGGNLNHRDFCTAEFAVPVNRCRSCLDLLFVCGARFVVVLFVERFSRGLAGKERFVLREGGRRRRQWRGRSRWS